MNDALVPLRQRRSVPPRYLKGPAPDAAQLEELLTVAGRVPDHGRLEPWRFIVFEGEGRERMSALMVDTFKADNPDADEAKIDTERQRFLHAPLIVAVVSSLKEHPRIPTWEQEMSAGAVCMNLITASVLMGFNATWLSGWAAFDRRILDAIGLTPSERIAGYIHIGTPTESAPDRPRPDLSKIVTRF
jgi:nitroreductase